MSSGKRRHLALRATGCCIRSRRSARRWAGLWIGCALLAPLLVSAKETYLSSDNYRAKGEVRNVFLADADYSRMIEDIERNDVEFDWGWVKQTGKKPSKPKVLAFNPAAYGSARISFVKSFATNSVPGLEDATRSAFALALRQLGLTVVDGPAAPAGLDLRLAIVDVQPLGRHPSVEIELKLLDGRSGEPLLLLRNEELAKDASSSVASWASELVKFLN